MEQTLVAAHALFAERGYAAVKMDEIAAAVGVTKPLLYNYFGNKEQLYIACMERAGDALTATVAEAVADSANPGDALGAGVRAFFAFLDSDRAAWAVLFDETLPRGGEVAERVAEYRGRILELVSGSMLAQLPQGSRDAGRTEVEALSTALLGAAEALARWWLRTEALSAEEAAELLISTVEPGPARPLGARHFQAHPKKERPPNEQPRPAGSPSSAATGSPSRAPTAPTRTPPTRTCSPPRSTAWSTASASQGEALGEVAGGAVLKHSRDRDLARESVLSTRLAPETPAYDVQQACGTGLETTILVANKIALGQIDVRHRLRRRHHLRRPDRAQRAAARDPAGGQPPALDRRQAARPDRRPPRPHRPRDPPQRGAAHRPLDGRALRDHGHRMGDRPGRAGRADAWPATRTSPPPTSAASSTT